MASKSGGMGGFGAFIIGVIAGAVGLAYGPGLYQKYVAKNDGVRVEVGSDHTPGVWRRYARLAIEFSAKRPDGKDWDWPMTSPELQVCVREGGEYRKCYQPPDGELRTCQGHFQCVTGPMRVPDVPFTIELYEWDNFNKPDAIGQVDCDVGQTCRFQLGSVTVQPQ